MPVTVYINGNAPKEWKQHRVGSREELLETSCSKEFRLCKKVLQSSFSQSTFADSHISASGHGFVYSMIEGYSSHHPVTIRPEDVWFAILSQLGFYINAHAEELRSFFVAHEGQKELVTYDVGTVETVDFGHIAQKMTDEMQKNVVDPSLRDWIMPAFSTTTNTDRVVAAVLMMGSLQAYFSYTSVLMCGTPSVTLLGEQADWDLIHRRLDRISQLGEEAAVFSALLKPILKRFVTTFDDPLAPDVLSFWARSVDRHQGSGMDYCSGWISAFCLWNTEGQCLRKDIWRGAYKLDDQQYHNAKLREIPTGFLGVPITINDNGNEFPARMVAGSVGIRSSVAPEVPAEIAAEIAARKPDPDDQDRLLFEHIILQGQNRQAEQRLPGSAIEPLTGWWLFSVNEEAPAS